MESAAMMSICEAVTMQLDEMELLETAYPEIVFDPPDPRPLLREALLETTVRQQDATSTEPNQERLIARAAEIPLISFRCPLSKDATLKVRLARHYPQTGLITTVEGSVQLKTATRSRIVAAVETETQRFTSSLRNEPQGLQILTEAMLAASDEGDSGEEPATSSRTDYIGSEDDISLKDSNPVIKESLTTVDSGNRSTLNVAMSGYEAPAGAGKGGLDVNERTGKETATDTSLVGNNESVSCLGRRLIYSHHIIAQQKRAGILKTARELDLGGFSKIGWPGVIVVEGDEGACEEFVKTLRTWRWKHLAVRGEETIRVRDGRKIEQERLLSRPLEELGQKEGVSALAQRCRAAGLGDLFSTLLR